ncbi:MAG: outer membrane beta-barrel protein [Vicinamibacterales bacterium]
MQRHARTLIVVAGIALFAAQSAAAQGREWTDRGYININGAFQGATIDLNDATDIRQYGEDGRITENGSVDAGNLFDIGAGVRVWQNVSIGMGYSRGSSTSSVTVAGAVPHPLFFGQPRQFSENVGGLKHTEQAVHLQIGYMYVLSDAVDIQFFVGPSIFKLKQDVVSDVLIGEAGSPFTNIVAQPQTASRNESAVGVNVGLDVTYTAWRQDDFKLGFGGFVRYAGASTDIRVLANDVSVDLGGFQAGVGARVRF